PLSSCLIGTPNVGLPITPWPRCSAEARAMGTSRGEGCPLSWVSGGSGNGHPTPSAHTVAGRSTMSIKRCGVAAVEAPRAAGVSTIFGLMGSSQLEIYDAPYEAKDFTYIGVRHENCGTHMADAYGRITQTPGVFICGQAGPGAANMVLGLAQAKLAYAPVVVLTGLPGTEHLGRDTFQEIDQHVLFQPVTKRTFSVPRPERIPEFILEAFRVANTGRRGPVVVNIR